MQNSTISWIAKLMRITLIQATIAMTLCGVGLARNNYGQGLLDREVTVKYEEATLKNVLSGIEDQTSIKFAYSGSIVNLDDKVTLDVQGRKLGEVLDELLKPRNIEYAEKSDYIVLIQHKEEETASAETNTETTTGNPRLASVSGTVKDNEGNPMPGVNVILKGTTIGTSTDADGRYVIDAGTDGVLVYSFIGFKTLEVEIAGRSIIDISMEIDATTLQEVEINAGYWNVKERESTGNISKISTEDIQIQPVSNPLAVLQGRMPGVYVQQLTGAPGGSFNVQIRGQNSLRTSQNSSVDGNLPLYIIDGVPFTSTAISSFQGVNGYGSPLSMINPSDIESIEILKDADATSIYGSRGANGVVLITTKKGKKGPTKFDANFYRGIGQISNTIDLLSARQYIEMRKEAFKNDETEITGLQATDLLLWDTTRYTDWQNKLIGGTANMIHAQGSLSGGNENTQFLIGLGYYNETTVFPLNFSYRKVSGHFNLHHVTNNKKFRINISSNFAIEDEDLPTTDITNFAISLPPIAPKLYDENGNLNWESSTWTNPISYLKKRAKKQTDNIIINSNLSYEITPGLALKTNLGYSNMDLQQTLTNPLSSRDPAHLSFAQGTASFSNNTIKTWIVEPQMEFHRTFGKVIIASLLGATFQENILQAQGIEAYGYTNDALIENIQAATSTYMSDIRFNQYKYNAVFGRINFTWSQKYILNLTARRDGSSRFGPERRFENFGAIGAAWIFSNEKLFKNQSVISFGKVRSSYGSTGSDMIQDYGYMESYSTTTYLYQGKKGLLPNRIANPDFSWEKTRKFEIALDLGIFQDRISTSVSYFHNRSSNQLVGYTLPVLTGFSSVQYNLPATVQNTGLEFSLNTFNLKQANFEWTSAFNLTIPKNKLIEYPNLKGSAYANTYAVGESLFIRKRYQSLAVDPTTGTYIFEDLDKNGTLNNDDRQITKVGIQLFGGFQNKISYRGIEIDFFIQFVKQRGFNYINYFSLPGTQSNQPTLVMDRWQNAGDISSIQRFTQNYSSQAAQAYNNTLFYGDDVISDASFLRLKNVSVAYNLPFKWTKRLSLRNCKIYLQGQNLMTVTNYLGLDPETLRSASLPVLRVITLGAQITF